MLDIYIILICLWLGLFIFFYRQLGQTAGTIPISGLEEKVRLLETTIGKKEQETRIVNERNAIIERENEILREEIDMNNILESADNSFYSNSDTESDEQHCSSTEARLRVLESDNHLLRIANVNNCSTLELAQTTQADIAITFSKNTRGPLRTEAVTFGELGDEFEAAVSIFVDSNRTRCDSFDCRLHLRSLSSHNYDVTTSLELDPTCQIVHIGRRNEEHDEQFNGYHARRGPRPESTPWADRLVLIDGAGTKTGRCFRGVFSEQAEYALDQGALIKITFRLSINTRRVDLPPGDTTVMIEGQLVMRICSGLLSSWSSYWRVHFSTNWREDYYYVKDPGICFEEFKDMIYVISPVEKQVDEFNYISLLKIADRFEMPALAAMVERFLINFRAHSISYSKLYKLSTDDFDLPILRTVIMQRWSDSNRMMHELLTDRSFEELSERAKNLAYEKFTTAEIRRSLARRDDAYSWSEEEGEEEEDDW